MPEEEKPEEEPESQKDRKEKMREKMKEMREKGGGPGGMPFGGGLASMMQQMAGAGGRGGQQDKAMIETMKGLRSDMQEIKEYLKQILDSLEK
ncbi:hypothetical protein AKJ37_01475 [candidate division MSBL1 archaeon SCGC-AAA259I09]|uniref:Uncharacterized protein n=2 Tax=candidate division MSBL1 TaxID=215777 RepID=A0A133UT89_9EURY|nr:hypothetical protein AKJ38_01120 [candidate division MSBL1 archaeon SCGC-AAA259I14]KXA98055.1 hypothetical protein AKJ37_01475 [candidate division MSBL1 archaeon SCGC-AAA259I09]